MQKFLQINNIVKTTKPQKSPDFVQFPFPNSNQNSLLFF